MDARVVWIAVAALLVHGVARAEPEEAAPADSVTSQPLAASPFGGWNLSPFGDLRVRHERTQDIPGRFAHVARVRATARGGLAWTPHPRFGAELSCRAAVGSAQDTEFPRIDNDAPDTVEIDRANVWGSPWADGVLRAGRMAMPLRLTELVWDADLRPWGVVLSQRFAAGTLDVVRLGAGVWRRDRYDHDGVVAVIQAGYALREGAETSGRVVVSYLGFDRTRDLARQGLGRQNLVLSTGPGDPSTRYASDFRVLDLQLEGDFVAASLPVTAGVDLVRNLATNGDDNGVRTRLTVGRFGERWGAEVGWFYLRAEHEALMGAFASDDWWFRPRLRGHMVSATLGWSDWLRLRVFGTFEWRDGAGQRTERVVSELTLRRRAP